MTKASALRLLAPALIVYSALLFYLAQPALAQTTCTTPGEHPATASDLAIMTTDGITNPQIGQCWNPANFGGTAAAQAKAALKLLVCKASNDNYGGMGPNGTIDNLNPSFAVCANNFLQAEKQKMPELCINQGVRSNAMQQAYYNNYLHGTGPIACNPATASCEHPRGVAIDVNVNTQTEYQQLWSDAGGYGLDFYLKGGDKVHFVPTVEVNNPNASGPCMTANYTPNNTNITIMPGAGTGQTTGGSSQAGQIATQNSICVISIDPSYTVQVPAGTPFPTNCISTAAAGACVAQNYCSGNIVVYQSSSCTVTSGQTCPYGCSNGACVQQQSTAAATPATGATTGGSGTAAGTTQTAGSASAQTSGASSGTNSTAGTVSSSGTSGSAITAPTLAANKGGTSTLAILNQLAAGSGTSAGSGASSNATTTPIVLNGSDSQITQLQPTIPGVSYAQPTSAYFSGSNGASGSQGAYTTTSGSGYEIGSSTALITNPGGSSPIAAAETASQPQPGVDTFSGSGPGPSAPSSASASYQSADTFNALKILNTLKAEVQGALAFLSLYAKPFQGVIPTQVGAD